MRVIKNEQKRRKIRQVYLSKKKAEDLSKKRKKEEKEADEEKKAYFWKKKFMYPYKYDDESDDGESSWALYWLF